MGSHTFVLRGRTKLEVCIQLRDFLDQERDNWSGIDPGSKKQAKKKMERDYERGEWVLWVRCPKRWYTGPHNSSVEAALTKLLFNVSFSLGG